ncbi:MAG: spiro-SPASM protein, partial [Spirochaetaceae bacterium]|nr:spiro-SPASM protein [Spirochaetaceae bacterium]
MRTAALVYAGSATELALQPLAGGLSAYERALGFAASLPDFAGALVLEGPQALPAGPFRRERREAWTPAAILESAESFAASFGEGEGAIEALVLLRADEPFLDRALAAKMLANFRRYRADYSFADGFPLGLAAEILHPRALPALRLLADRHPLEPERGWLFALVQKDINSFDIETEISPKDLRDLRLALACDTKRNFLLVERLLAAGVADAETALAVIPERLELQRTLPAFVQVQVAGGCPQACALCPYPLVGGEVLARRDFMPTRRYAALMEAVAAFSGDAVIDLSLWGEPSLHPDLEGLVEATLSHPGLCLIVETSGIGWKPATLERLAARWGSAAAQGEGRAVSPRLHWVVSLDASDPELYARLRGPGFEEAHATAELLLGLFPRSAHVQTLRAVDNEAALEDFWRGWKKRTDNVIVQKYSTFAGLLPPRKVTDLSPLTRRPCWHLKRDLAILLDGTVPLFRDCARNEIVLGKLFPEGPADGAADGAADGGAEAIGQRLAEAWAAGESHHRLHIEGDYPPPCADCD